MDGALNDSKLNGKAGINMVFGESICSTRSRNVHIKLCSHLELLHVTGHVLGIYETSS